MRWNILLTGAAAIGALAASATLERHGRAESFTCYESLRDAVQAALADVTEATYNSGHMYEYSAVVYRASSNCYIYGALIRGEDGSRTDPEKVWEQMTRYREAGFDPNTYVHTHPWPNAGQGFSPGDRAHMELFGTNWVVADFYSPNQQDWKATTHLRTENPDTEHRQRGKDPGELETGRGDQVQQP
jgi:hypothetical protein